MRTNGPRQQRQHDHDSIYRSLEKVYCSRIILNNVHAFEKKIAQSSGLNYSQKKKQNCKFLSLASSQFQEYTTVFLMMTIRKINFLQDCAW